MPTLHELYYHDVRLKQLRLQNFRGFGEVTLDFHPEKPVTVLIADNGGGKSTILDAAAEFLRRFFQLAIAGKNENDDTETLLAEKDIFNGRNNAQASAMLNISYPYPGKEVFQWMDDCARYLEDNHIEGQEAILGQEGEIWMLQIAQNENAITYYLPDEFQEIPINLTKLSNELGDFKIAIFNDQKWQPTLSLPLPLWRETKLEFQLRRTRPDPIEYKPLAGKPTTYADFIKSWEDGQGFITDYSKTIEGYYNRHNPLDETQVVLPLLVYYGGATINAKYDNELKVPYRPGKFQAYSHAFEPQRFEFEEFLAWVLWANEKQRYAWKYVKKTILDVLNAGAESAKFTTIEIEAQTLIFYKKVDLVPVPVETAQLSAGEKNIMALIGDLAKRAVQLNAVLFNADVDNETSSENNPLAYTPGIVLIDEIDLHLHPQWQRVILPKLREHFPRVQFVITTHSPLVLQSLEKGNIFSLPDLTQWGGLSGWEIYEIIQEAMSDTGKTTSDKYQIEMERFRAAVLNDNLNQLEESYQWLNEHLHPDNPKKPAIEMQYNIFSKKGEYK